MDYFCDNCRKMVEARYETLTDIFRVKDRDVKATIIVLKCPKCGEEVWDEENEKRNDEIVYRRYEQILKKEKQNKSK